MQQPQSTALTLAEEMPDIASCSLERDARFASDVARGLASA